MCWGDFMYSFDGIFKIIKIENDNNDKKKVQITLYGEYCTGKNYKYKGVFTAAIYKFSLTKTFIPGKIAYLGIYHTLIRGFEVRDIYSYNIIDEFLEELKSATFFRSTIPIYKILKKMNRKVDKNNIIHLQNTYKDYRVTEDNTCYTKAGLYNFLDNAILHGGNNLKKYDHNKSFFIFLHSNKASLSQMLESVHHNDKNGEYLSYKGYTIVYNFLYNESKITNEDVNFSNIKQIFDKFYPPHLDKDNVYKKYTLNNNLYIEYKDVDHDIFHTVRRIGDPLSEKEKIYLTHLKD